MNIVYNASAGTGKTYQVTRLYEKLVIEDGIDPRRILLMTFTDNAGGELRMRVSHRLLKTRRMAEAEGNDALAERAATAMNHLPAAPIGTIHSFCTRLLREHALEAGLSPAFSVLAGDDRDELLNQICRDELLARLGSDPDFKTFCSGAYIIGSGKGFGTSVTETVPKLIGEAGSLGISLENAEAMLPEPKPVGSIREFKAILDRLHELPCPTAKAKPVIQALETHLPHAKNVCDLVEKLKSEGLGKFGGGKGHKPISDDFFDLFSAADGGIEYGKRFPAAKAFASYVQSVARRFQQQKHALDAVDFDDQLLMARQLLESGKAKPEFDYVIVDEVQDTSRIQCDIILNLWGKDTYLVICGDKKQSIYTWRGADPQVMPDIETKILAANGHLESLQTSYRSKATIIDVVNKLFKSVYGDGDYAAGDCLQSNPDFETEGEKPCIEFLEADHDDTLPKQEKVAAEMEAVANRIRLLVKGTETWRPKFRYAEGFQPVGNGNGYRYSDILILLRRTTHQSALEQALRHAGIPYTLGGKGRGLFTRQETRDVSLFLNVVTHPKDVYSLVGFLRSPWVGLSDEAIAGLAWSDAGFSGDNLLAYFNGMGFQPMEPMDHGRDARAQDARATLLRYRELLGTKLASELVRRLIDETGYDALLAGLPRGTQRLANLRKVIDWLRENERGARTTPSAVARKLAEQIKNPPHVPEAALLDPARNAVTIMTVHGAKGLTKRVVMVPDISSRLDSDKGFAHVFFDEHKNPVLGTKITAPDKSSAESPGLKAAKERGKAVREHEFRNLFYVAMTRARDLVVASATIGKNPEGWLKHLEPLLGNDIPTIPYSTLSTAVEVPKTSNRRPPTSNQLAAALESLHPPPAIPKLQRIPATRLAKESDELEPEIERYSTLPTEKAAAMGSLGHAVLEQLALNGWNGVVEDWLERLCDEFGVAPAEASTLSERIGRTRLLMLGLTGGMREIRPEFPFVLLDGNRLIDGTIDLLCNNAEGVVIFDYKFTEAKDHAVVDTYREQMKIYCQAATKAFPNAKDPEVSLVVVTAKETRLVPMAI